MASQISLKELGEESAAAFLRRRGFRILERNWRTKLGELDLVAMDGTTLVFVEVKARKKSGPYDPSLAVNYLKQQKIRRLAELFLARRPRWKGDCRFDVVSVVVDGSRTEVAHLPNAFQ